MVNKDNAIKDIVGENKKYQKLSNDEQQSIAIMLNKAITDPAFFEKLKDDPVGVFKENGIKIPLDLKIKVISEGQDAPKNNENEIYLKIPTQKELDDMQSLALEDKDLDNVVGGVFGKSNFLPKMIRSFSDGVVNIIDAMKNFYN